MKVIRITASLVALLLMGCSSPINRVDGTLPALDKTPTLVVSPASYVGDPVGYVTAIMGSPGQPDGVGRFIWQSDNSRYTELLKATAEWCKANGGSLPATIESFFLCKKDSGEVLTRFQLGVGALGLIYGVDTPEKATLMDGVHKASVVVHKQYIASNGARGKITLVDKRSFEVVRFGASNETIDYQLATDTEGWVPLRNVKSVRRISPASDRNVGAFEVQMKDGSTNRDSIRLVNSLLRMKADGTLQADNIDLGGMSSSHMVLVIKMTPKSEPRQVRISVKDIARLDIHSIDGAPRVRLSVQTIDRGLAQSIKRSWIKESSDASAIAYNGSEGWLRWCDRISYPTIETELICSKLIEEDALGLRVGILTPSTAPATLSGQANYRVHAARSLF